MRGKKAKAIRKAVYGEYSHRIPRDTEPGKKLRAVYQEVKRKS